MVHTDCCLIRFGWVSLLTYGHVGRQDAPAVCLRVVHLNKEIYYYYYHLYILFNKI